MNWNLRKIGPLALICVPAILSFLVSPAVAQQADTAENVWISSLTWSGDQQIIGTRSEGLLLRPGKLVKLSASEPQKLEVIGEAESSLWALISLENSVLTSDYKGQLLRFQDNQPNKLKVDARWMRCLKEIPNNSKEILAGTEDGQLIVIDTENGNEARRTKLEPAAAIFDVAFHPQQNQVAVAMGDGNVHLLAWPSLEKQSTLKVDGAIWTCLYSLDGTQLLTGGTDRRIRLWDVASASPIVSIASARDWVTSMQLLPETTFVIAGCMNGEILLVDYHSRMPVRSQQAATSGIWDVALSADGKRLALGTRKHGVQIIDCSEWASQAAAAVKVAESENKPPQPAQ